MYTHTYTFVSKLPDDSLLPIIKYTPYTHASMHTQSYQSQLSSTARSHLAVMPLINLPSYLGIEAFDPCITTQVNGIQTIARRMDDENKPPRNLYLISHLKSLTGHKVSDHWHTLDSNFRFKHPYIYLSVAKTSFGKTKTFVLNTHVAINVESCSDTSCSRIVQFIRAQV